MKKQKFANSNPERSIINKRNAFTLIELLAIIVILAIIAVITVPIILNIIDNSSEGAAKDSAYGYKDAVNKYYLTKSVADSSQQSPSGVKYISEIKSDGLTISGQEPTEGWVKLDKGQVISYSLKFGDYVVTYDESTQNPVSKKNGGLAIATCPGCVFAWYTDHKWIKGSGYGENESSGNNKLTNYTDDYTTLEKNYFLGHVIDDNNYIIKSYACGIENNKAFCLERTSDGSKYSSNVDILNSVFPGCNADASASDLDCAGSSVHGRAGSNGYVDVYSGSAHCTAPNAGDSFCNV